MYFLREYKILLWKKSELEKMNFGHKEKNDNYNPASEITKRGRK